MCIAVALFAAVIASCGTVSPSTPVLSISEVLNNPEKFDGWTVTVEAVIRDAGPHGMFLMDLHHPRKALNLHIQPAIAWSEPVMEMTRMLLIDRDREEPLGVVGNLTGTFSWSRDELSLLSVSKLENLRWGSGLSR